MHFIFLKLLEKHTWFTFINTLVSSSNFEGNHPYLIILNIRANNYGSIYLILSSFLFPVLVLVEEQSFAIKGFTYLKKQMFHGWQKGGLYDGIIRIWLVCITFTLVTSSLKTRILGLWFSWQWLWRVLMSGMWCCLVW